MLSDEAALDERLRIAGHDRDAFLHILADGEIRAWPGAEVWRDGLDDVFERRHAGEPLPVTLTTQVCSGVPSPSLFTGFLRPFLETGAARLRAGARAVGVRHALPDALLGVRAEQALLENLASRLLGHALRLLILELHIAGLRGKLPKGTSRDRFEYFATHHFEDREALRSLLRKAPVLARLLATTLDWWVATHIEFLERLAEDRALLRDTFSPSTDIGSVAALQPGISDLHRRGRHVIQLELTSGLKLIYKPRSLAIDVEFQRLLEWLNAKGLPTPHRTIKVADRGSHGWVELVEPAACDSRDAVERFYVRQGSYVALLHVLKAVDFHLENLVASGEHPVLIDLEGLLHHDILPSDAETAHDKAAVLLRRSILTTGLLPVFMPNGGGPGVDFSGLGGDPGQLIPCRVATVDNVAHDTMQVTRRQISTQGSNNRPQIDGRAADPTEFVESMVEGFRQTYDLLTRHRDELARILDAFADVEVRHVLRPTMRYALLLSEGSHPDLLRDALERDRLLDKLWAEAAHRLILRRVIQFESADLRLGDIPIFTARPGEPHLFSSTGERIDNFFQRDSLSEALSRLSGMSAEDCDAQISFLRQSLLSLEKRVKLDERLELARCEPTERSRPSERASPTTADELLSAAVGIGERLKAEAIYGRGARGAAGLPGGAPDGSHDVTWIGVMLLVSSSAQRWILAPLQTSLFDGLGGMALFFAHLAAATGRSDFEALARASLQPILRELERPLPPREGDVGVFTGQASHLYVLSHLAALWREPGLLDTALALVPAIATHVSADEALDIVGGVAGCAMALLGLHRQTKDRAAIEAAKRCGERLLEKAIPMQGGGIGWKVRAAERPLSGFSHGVAGIAWALLELSAATGDERFRDAAQRALVYERSLFVPARGNWVDLRDEFVGPPGTAEHVMTAWCHGASGVTLGRLLSLKHLDNADVRSEIEIGLETMLRERSGMSHCLCHGDLGNLDVLLVASDALERPHWRRTVMDRAAEILAQARQQKWLCGLPKQQETPSLMVGLAGIGFGLLRIRSPESVPSILSLQDASSVNFAAPVRADRQHHALTPRAHW